MQFLSVSALRLDANQTVPTSPLHRLSSAKCLFVVRCATSRIVYTDRDVPRVAKLSWTSTTASSPRTETRTFNVATSLTQPACGTFGLLRAEVRPRHTSSPGPPLVASSGKNTITTGRTRFPVP